MTSRNVEKGVGWARLVGILVGCLLLTAAGVGPGSAQASAVDIDALTPLGAFRISSAEFGVSDINYAVGPIGYHGANDSLFVVGQAHDNAVGEFAVPRTLGQIGTPVAELPVVEAAIQPFTPMLDRAPTGNPDEIDRINGLFVADDGRLLVNAEQWYDADGGAQDTTLVLEDADALNGTIAGYYQLDGAVHAGGYLSPVPRAWQDALGGPVLTGWASNTSIISRHSVGPSLFTMDPGSIPSDATADQSIATTLHMDFPFADGRYLDPAALDTTPSGAADLWNHLAKARYGFIVPGTSTFMVLGSIGGVESGIGYKITQDDGNLCGGYCAYAADDYRNAYWLFDLDEIAAADQSHLPRPYAHGTMDVPYDDGGGHAIIGATFDPTTSRLFVSLGTAGQVGTYDRPPLFVVYDVATGPDESPTPLPPAGGPEPELDPDTDSPSVERVSGATRAETAAALAGISHPDGAAVALLARQDAYPDALAGGPLATRVNGPLLLTSTDDLPDVTRQALERLGPDQVIVLGGTAAVSQDVEAQLGVMGIVVRRIAGSSRFQTAAAIAAEFDSPEGAYLTLGTDQTDVDGNVIVDGWPDAVGVAALAARQGRPILLSTAEAVPSDTLGAIATLELDAVTIVGGTAAIFEAVEQQLGVDGVTVDRIAGPSRFATTAAVVARAVGEGADPNQVWIATGRAFPDALTAGPAVAASGGVLFLAEKGGLALTPDLVAHLTDHASTIETVRLVGGSAVLSEELAAQIGALLE